MAQDEADPLHKTTTWRVVFFTVNFTMSMLWVAMCVTVIYDCLRRNGTPFAFLGGICFIWPAMAWAIAEWALHFRNARRLERPLGIFCGLVGALALFALVSNAIEAAVERSSPGIGFWLVFGGVFLSIAAYGLWCAWLRVRRRTMREPPEPRGFPVIQVKDDDK